jgi:AraC-like DNA-binding protein
MKTYFEHHEKHINAQLLVILLIELGEQRGVHPNTLLKGTKLFQQDLTKCQLKISHQQFVQLIQNTLKYLPQTDIPFLLGKKLFPAHLGFIGQTLKHTRNIEDMIRVVACKQLAIFPFMFMRVASTKEHRYILFNSAISNESNEYQRFIIELLLSALVSIAKQKNIPLSRLQVKLPYAEPNHTEQYKAYLPLAYSFSPSTAASAFSLQIKFDLGLLKIKLQDSNALLTAYYIKQLSPKNHSVGFLQFIMQLLSKQLERRKEVNLDWLANQLGVSPATLKRKLIKHGTNYQQIIDTIHQQAAVFLLTEKGLNIEQTAYELRFYDSANFRRSFKRWTGITPANFLKDLNSPLNHFTNSSKRCGYKELI